MPARHLEALKKRGPRPPGAAWWMEGPEKFLAKREMAYEALKPEGGAVMLIGSRGTGKTQLACELMLRLAVEGDIFRCQSRSICGFEVLQELLDAEKATWRTKYGDGEHTPLQRAQEYGLLILDEVQERFESAWEDRVLTVLFDHRYREMRRTILVANIEAKNISEKLPASIVSRLTEVGTVIDCDWPSFRGA